MKFKSVGAVLLITAVGLSGCGSVSANSDGDSGSTITIVRPDAPRGLLPTGVTDNSSIPTLKLIYDNLVNNPPDGDDVVPGIAESWDLSENDTLYTFHLRPGQKFSNGQDLGAKDVVFSIKEAKKDSNPYSTFGSNIQLVKAVDKDTVTIKLSQPSGQFLSVLALFAYAIVPEGYAGNERDDFMEHPIGSGPYKLKTWQHGQQLQLERNEYYWDNDSVRTDNVEFRTITDPTTRSRQVQTGRADVNTAPPLSQVEALKDTSKGTVEEFPSTETHYLLPNNSKPPFDDPKVRQAVSLAIGRDSIIAGATYGHGTPAGTYMNPNLWAHDDVIQPPDRNIEQAKQLLSEAGYDNGFEAKLNVKSGDTVDGTTAQIIQQELSQVGISIAVTELDQSAFDTIESNHGYDLELSYFTSDMIDPHQSITFVSEDRINTGQTNKKLRQLSKSAAEDPSTKDRAATYDEIQQIVADEAIVIPVYYLNSFYELSNEVHNFDVGPMGDLFIKDTWTES